MERYLNYLINLIMKESYMKYNLYVILLWNIIASTLWIQGPNDNN